MSFPNTVPCYMNYYLYYLALLYPIKESLVVVLFGM